MDGRLRLTFEEESHGQRVKVIFIRETAAGVNPPSKDSISPGLRELYTREAMEAFSKLSLQEQAIIRDLIVGVADTYHGEG